MGSHDLIQLRLGGQRKWVEIYGRTYTSLLQISERVVVFTVFILRGLGILGGLTVGTTASAKGDTCLDMLSSSRCYSGIWSKICMYCAID